MRGSRSKGTLVSPLINTYEDKNRMSTFQRLLDTMTLQEGYANSGSPADTHAEYIDTQNKYYATIPNIIPSAAPGLSGFDKAIQSVDTIGNAYQDPAIAYPNEIFKTDISPDLAALAKQCASSSIDDLIAVNQNKSIGCGWIYTKPNKGSPYPVVSSGVVGTSKGPLPGFTDVQYNKWYFDLNQAKEAILVDKCAALKTCTEVDNDIYSGYCGYCTDTNQGIPIDKSGKPLYPSNPRANCSPASIVTNGVNCPPPPPPGAGPQPIVDRTCDPVNGRLSSACMYNQVLAGGCKDDGALAMALKGSSDPQNYIGNLTDSDSVKIYNKVANPPMNMDLFKQGRTTVTAALQEVRTLAGNATKSATSGIGASARDLCLNRGAISGYSACNEISDGTAAPFEIICVQNLFLKMGGQGTGTMFPNSETINTYNTMGTYGGVKQYLNQLIADMKGSDYAKQRAAMTKFLGITPEQGIKRAPYEQGVEVFWMVPDRGDTKRVRGFLRRTIERDIVQLRPGPSSISQIGGGPYGAMLQLTDIRAPSEFAVKFKVQVDDGFWIAVNHPADIDKLAMTASTGRRWHSNIVNVPHYAWGGWWWWSYQYVAWWSQEDRGWWESDPWPIRDQPGLFENLGWQGPTWYESTQQTTYHANKPNITKIYFEDAGGGWNCLQIQANAVSGQSSFKPANFSLTCEKNAPFLTYEVGPKSGEWEELRNPGLFGQFMSVKNPEYHTRTDERASVPGKKGFMRFNSDSYISTPNIAFQSWKTLTFAIRFQTMPVNDRIFHFWTHDVQTYINVTPINGSTSIMTVMSNIEGNNGIKKIPMNISLNVWYIIVVSNNETGLSFKCAPINDIANNRGSMSSSVSFRRNRPIYLANANEGSQSLPGQVDSSCNVIITGSATFKFDVAWTHFFDQVASSEDIVRECKADWVYTAFPDSYDMYKTK